MRRVEHVEPRKASPHRFQATRYDGGDPSLVQIGTHLRAFYGLIDEPVPERFLRLLERLDEDSSADD